MSLHFFAIPALDPAAAQAELNAFCQRHRVLKVERHLVDAGLDSHWVLCLQVADGPGPLPAHLKTPQRQPAAGQPAGEPAARVDWKQVLDEADFTVFAQLRQARKALAEREGVSRPGLGVHAAVATGQRNLQRWSCWVQVCGVLLSVHRPSLGESRHGLRFCGFEVRQGAVWPGPRKRQRFAQGAERLAAAADVQPLGPDWQRAHDALHATLAHTHSLGLRQRVWARQAGLHDDAADDLAPRG